MDGNKRIAFNSLIIFSRLCVVSVISLISSRIVLQALGVSDFGLYNVVGGIVTLLNVVNTAMVSTTYRYIAYELGKGEKGNTNKIFNTSFTIHAGFAVLILFLGICVGLFYIYNYLNVSPEKIEDARFVLEMSVVATMISTLFVPFSGLLVAYEKFHVPAIIDVLANLIRLALLFFLLYFDGNRIRLYSCIMLMFIVIQNSLIYLYSRINYKEVIRFNLQTDKNLYKEMFGFSGWILIGACSSVGKIQGSAMIINYFFGTIVNGAYAVSNQVNHFIELFARSLNKAAIPQITKNFSGGNKDRSVMLASYISKYTFMLMTIVAFPVLLEMDFLLGLWLKDVPEGASVFCKLMVLCGLIGSVGEGVPALVQASGKMKYFQMILSTMSLSGLPVSFLLFHIGYPPYYILMVYCVINGIAAFIRLFLLKKILKIDISTFLDISYLKVAYVSIPLIVVYALYNPSDFSVTQHLMGLAFSEIVLFASILVLGLDKREWGEIKKFLKNKRLLMNNNSFN